MVQPGLSERSESGPNMDVKNLIVLMSPSSRDRDFGGGEGAGQVQGVKCRPPVNLEHMILALCLEERTFESTEESRMTLGLQVPAFHPATQGEGTGDGRGRARGQALSPAV